MSIRIGTTIVSGGMGGGSSVEIDNESITMNTSAQIQTIGVIDTKTGSSIKEWTGTLAEYEAIATKDDDTTYYITDDCISGKNVYGRNIGDIFYTSRTDNVLGGAVECNGSTYQTSDYVGSGSIGELLASGKLPYVSLSQYASLLTSNGVVGVFGWDGTGTTDFRVPTLNNVFIECGQASVLGDYISAGLPNIAGRLGVRAGVDTEVTGAFIYSRGTTPVNSVAASSEAVDVKCTFDASRSSSIYGNSTTVQPKSIKYRAMVQLYNSIVDSGMITYNKIAEDVAELQQDVEGLQQDVEELQQTKVTTGHEVIAFQAPTASNNYTWYRKYADGWVEQGCGNPGNFGTINLPIQMANTYYNITITPSDTYYVPRITGRTTTTFTSNGRNIDNSGLTGTTSFVSWQVSGMAAN